MENMDTLYVILQESAEIYESFIKIEYDKYDAVIKEDIKLLDEIISKEQAFFLKTKGIEQKKNKITQSMHMKDKTLKEIIEMADEEYRVKLKLVYDRLLKSLKDFKKINTECKTLIEVRLRRIDNALSKLGERENSYNNGENQTDNFKSHIVSKMI